MDNQLIQYRVRPITRYVVTRFESADRSAGCEGRGEYDNAEIAFEVGYALCKAEHDRLGWPPGDERIKYPENPSLNRAFDLSDLASLSAVKT